MTSSIPLAAAKTEARPVWLATKKTLEKLLADSFRQQTAEWVRASGFKGEPGTFCAIPDEAGNVSGFLVGADTGETPLATGHLARILPEEVYRIENLQDDPSLAALGFCLGAYAYDRYRKSGGERPKLCLPDGVDEKRVHREAEAAYFVRDLINTPANDMGPEALEAETRKLAETFNAALSVIAGDELIDQNFPMIHAVGRASTGVPRLLDMVWGNLDNPKITLVGKGVCFDTGGLNLKPGASMSLMKKDMGGAANVLGLARMIMQAQLPVRLRVLIPAVENSVSGNAFRPGDVLPSRKGITVEIGNTDAEGRLVLGDALTLAAEEEPQLIVDMATLTGAARVALGPDLPPFYTGDDELAGALETAAAELCDPLWRMPLWKPYEKLLASKVADTSHISSGPFAGSVTAALFLQKFVPEECPWIHLDIFGWVPNAKPWAPVGGEAQGIRALYKVIEGRFC